MTDQQAAPITDAELEAMKDLASKPVFPENSQYKKYYHDHVPQLISALRAERARADRAFTLLKILDRCAAILDDEDDRGSNVEELPERITALIEQLDSELDHYISLAIIDPGSQYRKSYKERVAEIEAQLAKADRIISVYFQHAIKVGATRPEGVDEAHERHLARAAQKESDNG